MMLKQAVLVLAGAMFYGTLVPLASSGETKPSESQDKIRIVCPAIEEWDLHRTINGPPDQNSDPIQLVVLATARRVETPEQRRIIYDLEVEKVLYGGPVGKTLRISSSYWYMPGPPRQIYGLQPVYSKERGDYEYNYGRSPDEEQAEAAVAEARLDYHALSAVCIFVGKVVAYDRNSGYTVEVVRLLKGSTPKPGEKVGFAVSGLYGREEPPKSIREPMLYFIDSVENDEDEHRIKCSVKTRLPLGAEKEVLAALKRRDEHPIVEVESGETTPRCREVMFRGSVESAIQFLGSESEAAVTLAKRALVYRKDSARDKIVAAIETRHVPQHRRAPTAVPTAPPTRPPARLH